MLSADRTLAISPVYLARTEIAVQEACGAQPAGSMWQAHWSLLLASFSGGSLGSLVYAACPIEDHIMSCLLCTHFIGPKLGCIHQGPCHCSFYVD